MSQNTKNRITKYLTPRLNDYLFGELPAYFLEETGTTQMMKGIPFPVKKTRLTDESLTVITIAQNMSFVLGCDPDFKYRENYMDFIHQLFTNDFVKPLISRAVEAAENLDFETAVIHSRAALAFEPENQDAMLIYARACHDCYEGPVPDGEEPEEKDAEYVGCFKAESMTTFERLTTVHPECAPAYYYLGYAYLNMGLYVKSKLTFDEFLVRSEDEERRKEVQEMVEQLKDPVIIEEGVNAVTSGRFESGIEILSRYENNPMFRDWWPLWYYLGLAYHQLGQDEISVEKLREVLKYSPSNTDAMEILMDAYTNLGDFDMVEKYQSKIGVIQRNREMDREESRKKQGVLLS